MSDQPLLVTCKQNIELLPPQGGKKLSNVLTSSVHPQHSPPVHAASFHERLKQGT